MKDLKQITVIGLGLLGGSITLRASHSFPKVKIVGYAHRPATRKKAKQLKVAAEITSHLKKSVSNADIVILATPICIFEETFAEISDALPAGAIVTDVGSTKTLPHRWADELLPKSVHYVGSHPIAGSEQRGVAFAEQGLFENTSCILTATKKTNAGAVGVLTKFWSKLGCSVKTMTPVRHDRIFAKISHLPHITAASLINANDAETLKFAGMGFIDTTRIASGPANIWADILLTNAGNCAKEMDRIIAEMLKMKRAIESGDKKQIEKLLEKAKDKRNEMIGYKIRKKELV